MHSVNNTERIEMLIVIGIPYSQKLLRKSRWSTSDEREFGIEIFRARFAFELALVMPLYLWRVYNICFVWTFLHAECNRSFGNAYGLHFTSYLCANSLIFFASTTDLFRTPSDILYDILLDWNCCLIVYVCSIVFTMSIPGLCYIGNKQIIRVFESTRVFS